MLIDWNIPNRAKLYIGQTSKKEEIVSNLTNGSRWLVRKSKILKFYAICDFAIDREVECTEAEEMANFTEWCSEIEYANS